MVSKRSRASGLYQFEIPPGETESLNLLFFSEMTLFWFNQSLKNNPSPWNIFALTALQVAKILMREKET